LAPQLFYIADPLNGHFGHQTKLSQLNLKIGFSLAAVQFTNNNFFKRTEADVGRLAMGCWNRPKCDP